MKLVENLCVLALIGGFSVTVQAGGDAAAGQAIASKTCQACHGVDGNNDNPQFPRLAGQHADYMVKALADYKSGARSNAIMGGPAGQAAALSEQDMEDVAAWYASQRGVVTPAKARTVSR